MYRATAAGYMRREGRGVAVALILFALALAAPSLGGFVDRFVPVSFWFEVRSVHVFDAPAGEDPRMAVDRTIHRPFTARYIAIVRRRGENGFSHFCSGSDTTDYQPDAAFPDPLTLSWWTWPKRCALPPGTYRLDTLWRIETQTGVVRDLRNRSNEFRILDAD